MEMLNMLLNYGVLGLWTITLLIDRYKRDERFRTLLDDLKRVLTDVKLTFELQASEMSGRFSNLEKGLERLERKSK